LVEVRTNSDWQKLSLAMGTLGYVLFRMGEIPWWHDSP